MNYIEKLLKKTMPPKFLLHLRNFYLLSRSMIYKGNKYTCPCCNNHFRKFLPEIINKRPDVQCPRCRSLERHRLIWLYLKKTNLFSENFKMLHIAPEFCFQRQFTKMPNINYYSADLRSPYVRIKMDITNIMFADNFFDVILCSHVLEHIPEDKKAMSELFRVLKPGGWAIIDVPIDKSRIKTFEDPNIVSPQDRKRFYGHIDHVRLYGKDFFDRLEEAGFKVRVDSFVKTLDDELVKKYKLSIENDIYFCSKIPHTS